MRAREFLGIWTVAVALGLLACVAPAPAAPTGAIIGATADPSWSGGTVEHLSETFDECGSPSVAPQCTWSGLAVAISQTEGGCPTTEVDLVSHNDEAVWEGNPPYTLRENPYPVLPGHQEPFYANGTVEGGPVTFSLRNPLSRSHPFDEVCLYVSSAREWEPGCTGVRCTILMEPQLIASAPLVVRPKRKLLDPNARGNTVLRCNAQDPAKWKPRRCSPEAASVEFSKLRWRNWGDRRALGTGIARVGAVLAPVHDHFVASGRVLCGGRYYYTVLKARSPYGQNVVRLPSCH
jgi:hypothetical protein